jgi:hypothetical protein
MELMRRRAKPGSSWHTPWSIHLLPSENKGRVEQVVVGYKRKIALFSNKVGVHPSVPPRVSHLESGKDHGKDLGKDELSKGKVKEGPEEVSYPRGRVLQPTYGSDTT